MLLFHEFVISVRKGTGVSEKTPTSELPVSAHLGLELGLVMLNECFSFLIGIKMALRSLNSGKLFELFASLSF
jgi:hypothetical protein